MSTLRLLSSLALVAAFVGCQYDLDKIYDFAENDAGLSGDGGKDAAVALVSQQLIGAWTGNPAVDSECVQCAEAKCAEVDSACRADPDCLAYTQCAATTPTPAGQAACRAKFSAWVNAANIRERDLNGPYGQCVFRDNCAAECDGNVDLACSLKYAWPSTPDRTVPLQLYLTDAQDQTKFLPNLKVRACTAGTVPCPADAPMATTNSQGFVELNLPTSFDRSFTGYLEVSDPMMMIVPTLIKFSWNIGSPTNQIISIVNMATFMASTVVLDNIVPDPTRGQLQLRMLGCNGFGVRGVSFTASNADPKTKSWYIVNGIPNLRATETNVIGSAGIFDLPPSNNVTAVAKRASDGMQIASADAPVRAGYMTVIIFAPLATQ